MYNCHSSLLPLTITVPSPPSPTLFLFGQVIPIRRAMSRAFEEMREQAANEAATEMTPAFGDGVTGVGGLPTTLGGLVVGDG